MSLHSQTENKEDLMEIIKIAEGKKKTKSSFGSPCVECAGDVHNTAEFVITIGGHKAQICKPCLRKLTIISEAEMDDV